MMNTTKEKIIECGARALVEKSYNGCGLKEILDAAGVPKGSFYHYFRSKEDFGIAVIEHSARTYTQKVEEFLKDRRVRPLQRIENLFEFYRAYHVENGFERECLVAKLALEIANLSPSMRAAVKSALDQWGTQIAQCIREAQAEGELDGTIDPEALADFLCNAWEGAMIRMQVDRSIEPVNGFMQFIFRRLLAPAPVSA